MKKPINKKMLIFEIIFWLSFLGLLISATIMIVLNETTNEKYPLFAKIMGYITMFLAIMQAPMTLLKVRNSVIDYMNNVKYKRNKKQKEQLETMFRKKAKEKKVAKALQAKAVEKELKNKNKAIIAIDSNLSARGIKLQNDEIYQFLILLKRNKNDEAINFIYQKSGKRIQEELLKKIKSEFK